MRRLLIAAGAATALVAIGGTGRRMIASWMDANWQGPVHLVRSLKDALPLKIGAWEGTEAPVPDGILRIANHDDYVSRQYRNAQSGEVVALFVGYTERPRTIIRHRPTVCYPNAGWSRLDSQSVQLKTATGELPMLVHEFIKPGPAESRQLVGHYYIADGRHTVDERCFDDRPWRKLFGGPTATHFVAQVQIVAGVSDSSESAHRRLRQFAEDAGQYIQNMLPSAPATDGPHEAAPTHG